MIRLETDRLIIRDHYPTDLNELHKLLTDPNAMYYLQDLRTDSLEESNKNLNVSIKEAGSMKRTKYFFALVKKPETYLGEIGFTVTTDTPEGKVVNLGYFILPEFWGNGYVTEAVKRLISYAFEECDVHKITTGCIKENSKSENIMIKSGMQREAEFKKHIWHDGRWKDRVEYGLLKKDWEKDSCSNEARYPR